MVPTSYAPNTQHKYVVRDKQKVCIILFADIAFDIQYQQKDGLNATTRVKVPDGVAVGGNCHYNNTDNVQQLTLTFFDTAWVLGVFIARDSMNVQTQSGHYSWQEISLSYQMDSHFPHSKAKGSRYKSSVIKPFGLFESDTDGSYKCSADQTISLGKEKDIRIEITNMRYRAFGITNSTDISSKGVTECSADKKKGGKSHKKVGVAVGCSMAALVVVLIVAWVVYRRRKIKYAQLRETLQ